VKTTSAQPTHLWQQCLPIYFKESSKTKKELRLKKEKETEEAGSEYNYPEYDELRLEELEPKAYLLFTIFDSEGQIVNRLTQTMKKGVQRLNWNFRYPSIYPVSSVGIKPGKNNTAGNYVLPGEYFVSLSKVVNNQQTELVGKTPFKVQPLHQNELEMSEMDLLFAFMKDVNELRKAVKGTYQLVNETGSRLKQLRNAAIITPSASSDLYRMLDKADEQLLEIKFQLSGDKMKEKRNIWIPPTIAKRVDNIVYGLWRSYGPPTSNMEMSFKTAKQEFIPLLGEVTRLIEIEIKQIEEELDRIGAPYTPGRIPQYYHD